ncbi:hypothetical protein [Cacatuid alphaherpesvirus 2]|uniref:C2H2-type domain-containing protein n=1 Tax=Cacatuid alphaherpesvirus 2 TaxID=2604840 RepID=A0A5B9R4P5_9ALPH|nr:hypothetical protein QKT46_gp02 [Cacatuid alphaherpesvirus 2]QEG54060.1 hypothetical protein [Cacatuid alphaherpesvirus 2]
MHCCDYCGKILETKYGLRRHIRNHKKLDPDYCPTSGEKLNCRACLTFFWTRSDYEHHKRRHASLVKCAVCPSLCASNKTFDRHNCTLRDLSVSPLSVSCIGASHSSSHCRPITDIEGFGSLSSGARAGGIGLYIARNSCMDRSRTPNPVAMDEIDFPRVADISKECMPEQQAEGLFGRTSGGSRLTIEKFPFGSNTISDSRSPKNNRYVYPIHNKTDSGSRGETINVNRPASNAGQECHSVVSCTGFGGRGFIPGPKYISNSISPVSKTEPLKPSAFKIGVQGSKNKSAFHPYCKTNFDVSSQRTRMLSVLRINHGNSGENQKIVKREEELQLPDYRNCCDRCGETSEVSSKTPEPLDLSAKDRSFKFKTSPISNSPSPTVTSIDSGIGDSKHIIRAPSFLDLTLCEDGDYPGHTGAQSTFTKTFISSGSGSSPFQQDASMCAGSKQILKYFGMDCPSHSTTTVFAKMSYGTGSVGPALFSTAPSQVPNDVSSDLRGSASVTENVKGSQGSDRDYVIPAHHICTPETVAKQVAAAVQKMQTLKPNSKIACLLYYT